MSEKRNQLDLRVIKTRKALLDALSSLLIRKTFKRITVNDICDESQMSRTAFYAHFNDKYDLLRNWLTKHIPEINMIKDNYSEIDSQVNEFIDNNRVVIVNMLKDANSETMELIDEFLSSLMIDFTGDKNSQGRNSFDIVFKSFCTGGIINLVLWQIRNNFPIDFKVVNVHFYKILDTLWQLKREDSEGP